MYVSAELTCSRGRRMSTKIDSLTNVHIFLLRNPFACLCSADDVYADVSTLRLSAFESFLVARCAMCSFFACTGKRQFKSFRPFDEWQAKVLTLRLQLERRNFYWNYRIIFILPILLTVSTVYLPCINCSGRQKY